MSIGRLAGKQNCCCSATTTTEARPQRDSDINALFCIDIKLITASLARHLLLRHATANIFARARFLICGCFILCLWPAAASHLPHPHHPAPIHLTVSGNTNTMHNTFLLHTAVGVEDVGYSYNRFFSDVRALLACLALVKNWLRYWLKTCYKP